MLTRYVDYHQSYVNVSYGSASSSAVDEVRIGMDVINEVYCDVFEAFGKLWSDRDPPNIMSFAPLFLELKGNFKSQYRPLTS